MEINVGWDLYKCKGRVAEWSKASLIYRIRLSQVQILAELLDFFLLF